MAQLSVDSDQAVDTELLITAAKDAIVPVQSAAGRTARPGRVRPRRRRCRPANCCRARCCGRATRSQADADLARFDPDGLDELQLVQWGIPRGGDPVLVDGRRRARSRGHGVAQRTRAASGAEAGGRRVAGGDGRAREQDRGRHRTPPRPCWPTRARPKQAVESPRSPPGWPCRSRAAATTSSRSPPGCRAEQKTTDGMIRVMVRYCDVLALTYIGELDLADKRAADYANFSSAGQFLAWAIAKITLGTRRHPPRQLPRGHLVDRAGARGAHAGDPLPWQLPATAAARPRLRRTGRAGRGRAGARRRRRAHRSTSSALHEPQRVICQGVVRGGQGHGAPRRRIGPCSGRQRPDAGQYAVEAEALHHAARFGDRTVAERLAALSGKVQGRRGGDLPRHAAAVAAADPAALDAVSAELEEAGLLLSAADAAAQAAPLHDSAGDRRGEHGVCGAGAAPRRPVRRRVDPGHQGRRTAAAGDQPRTGDRRAHRRRADATERSPSS